MTSAYPPGIEALQERAKELSCLYRVSRILGSPHPTIEQAFEQVIQAIPPGWQFPECCLAAITLGDRTYQPIGWRESSWTQTAGIRVRGVAAGELMVCYTAPRPDSDEGPFLAEERQLLDALAERIGLFLLARTEQDGAAVAETAESASGDWRTFADFLRRVDPRLVEWITHKLLNHLRWMGIAEAEAMLPGSAFADAVLGSTQNRPAPATGDLTFPTHDVLAVAARYCSQEELTALIGSWISQDRARALVSTLEDQGSTLEDIAAALEQFHHIGPEEEEELPRSVRTMLRVALLRRFFTDQLDFIDIAKDVFSLRDFCTISRHMLHPTNSHGKLGGKSANLLLAARIVEAAQRRAAGAGGSPSPALDLGVIRVPRTWYIASDALLAFVRLNRLEEVYDRKYSDIEEVRAQYPYVVRVFRSSRFPPELTRGLATALDALGDRPLIVRSTSLLEDRSGAAFSGKYKSLFLANRGTREQRLQALQEAVAEVYASVFGPDPIEYRAERNLLDVHEEMGIMIQEVVGRRVGRYFLPAFAGVAFSNNEFRWSPRIRREDGLVRLVPGLGTRAVDRLTDDYPILLSPGQPGLRVNTTAEEILRYSPRMVDLINLDTNAFESVPAPMLLRECGAALPMIRRLLSRVDGDRIAPPVGTQLDFTEGDFVFTLEGVVAETPFMRQMAALLRLLQERLGSPVDIEFASDGNDLFLLQCRQQSSSADALPAIIPRNLPRERVLFSAHRYVSNGRVHDCTHVVYVDPAAYAALPGPMAMRDVGRAVGRLNKLLPRRAFALLGPGRWGSRGDIQLGVSVTYSDINNTALLVEIARRHGHYTPDLSFGTHFFQDLVESGIRYLPLYPDEDGNEFRESFLLGAHNLLPELLPDMHYLATVLRVIDVARETGGSVLAVRMNGELDEAIAYFAPPAHDSPAPSARGT